MISLGFILISKLLAINMDYFCKWRKILSLFFKRTNILSLKHSWDDIQPGKSGIRR
jgi:hypothetical protein